MMSAIELCNYPICDTDIWIKLSKVTQNQIIFNKYTKALFSDAVIFELKNKKEDNEFEFGYAFEYYINEKRSGKIIKLELTDSNYFDSKAKRVVKKMFVDNNIEYDTENSSFKRKKHLGEKVSLIYAAVLNLRVLLSDDNGAFEHRKYIKDTSKISFPYVRIISLKQLLLDGGIREDDAIKICEQTKKSVEQISAENEIEKNIEKGVFKTKSLSAIKRGLELKGKL